MTEKMTVTFYRKEITWFGYKVEVDAKTNEEAMKKIKNFDYEEKETVDQEYDGLEGYGVFYFPDGTEIDDRDY